MNRVRTALLSAGFAAISCAAYAADTGATALLPPDYASAFKLSSAAGESAKMSTVAVKGQPFSSALRIEVSVKPRRSADVQISAPAGAATASGDVPMVSFWMRSGAVGEATLDAGFRATPGVGGAPAAARARQLRHEQEGRRLAVHQARISGQRAQRRLAQSRRSADREDP